MTDLDPIARVKDFKAKPFLKWAGGKRWLTRSIRAFLPQSFNQYFEPFLGGGAIYFDLMPRVAFLSDLNTELIATFEIIRDKPDDLNETLIQFQKKHSKEFYYQMRDLEPSK